MPQKKSKTNISDVAPGEIRIKGYDIAELMGQKSFAEIVYLVLRGELPTDAESQMLDAILVSCVDHGVTPPSTHIARTVISAGNPLNAAVVGGILAIGDTHGGAIEQAARILQEWASKPGNPDDIAKELIADLKSKGIRMPGFGHQLH